MTDITSFPSLTDVLYFGQNCESLTAGANITQGQVVAIHGTGVSKTVHPSVKGTTGQPIGVAIATVSSGGKVGVAGAGCVAMVVNADDTTAIDAGDPLEDNDNSVGGTVSTLPITGTGTVAVAHYCIGFAIDDIAGSGYGYALVMPSIVTQPNAS